MAMAAKGQYVSDMQRRVMEMVRRRIEEGESERDLGSNAKIVSAQSN